MARAASHFKKTALTASQYRVLATLVELYVELGTSPTLTLLTERSVMHRNTVKYNLEELDYRGYVKLPPDGGLVGVVPTPHGIPELEEKLFWYYIDAASDYLKTDENLGLLLDQVQAGREALCKIRNKMQATVTPQKS